MPLKVQEKKNGTVLVVRIPSRLTQENSEELRELLKNKVRAGHVNWVLDLAEVQRIDSSGLAAFVSQIATCRARKGDVRLARVPKSIRGLLEITHLDRILKSYPTVKQAVESFETGGGTEDTGTQ